jgi:hypothetical protein
MKKMKLLGKKINDKLSDHIILLSARHSNIIYYLYFVPSTVSIV